MSSLMKKPSSYFSNDYNAAATYYSRYASAERGPWAASDKAFARVTRFLIFIVTVSSNRSRKDTMRASL